MAKKFITHEAGNDEGWICLCGNTPVGQGFYPCDKDGKEMEPVSGWENLYVCDRCGRIIRQDTLEVVAQNPTVAERTFSSHSERDTFINGWIKKQKKPIKSGSAGEYIGDKEVMRVAGKDVSISLV